jgi:N-acetylneuraminic acid mutarotase
MLRTLSPLRGAVLTALAPLGIAACSADRLAAPSGGPSADPVAPVVPAAGDLAGYMADHWAAKSDMPTARRGLVTATVNGIIYAIGGRGGSETNLRTVEAFNPGGTILTPKWTTKAPLPAPRAWASGAQTINGKIYVAGGLNADGDATRSLYVYNAESNTWATKAQLPVASWAGGSGVINGKLYVVTPGTTGTQLHRYDPATNSWTARAQGPGGHYYPVVGVIAGKLYVAGTMNADEQPSRQVHMYDPATNSWTAKAQLDEYQIGAAGRVIGEKLYLVGGSYSLNGSTVPELHVYNPATNSWVEKAHMLTGRTFLSAAVSNGVLYAIGGLAIPNVLRTNQAYTP